MSLFEALVLFFILIGLFFVIRSDSGLSTNNYSSRRRCPSSESGEHNFTKWYDWGLVHQERKCKNCGLAERRHPS